VHHRARRRTERIWDLLLDLIRAQSSSPANSSGGVSEERPGESQILTRQAACTDVNLGPRFEQENLE
jgi:hypothetical protein